MTLLRDPEENETRQLHAAVPLAGKRVLEVGCGAGRLTWRFARSAGQVVGLDPNPASLRTAYHDCPPALRPTVAFALGDARAIPFAAGTFDVAVLAWSL
jgi:ubiquinone/menaquinone biosynthesis C-methylase UbiE